MQSNAKDLVVFGLAGRGKSTFLNYLLQGPEDDETKKLFTTASGSSSCTQEVTKITHQIYGTQQQVSIYDTPGVFASDLTLIHWLEAMKRGIPDSFDALIWMINIKERALTCDSILVNAVGLLLSNFSFDKVIFVFTHCDTLMTKDPSPQEAAELWLSSLNETLADKSFKDNLKQNQIVYFGREEGKKYSPNYTSEFVSALNAVASEGEAKMKMKEQLDTSVMVNTVLEKTEPSYKKMVEDEIERLKEIHKGTEIRLSGFGIDVTFKTCYSEDTVVYRWNEVDKRPDAVAMKEIKAGDRLVTLTRESSGTFRCELEPAIVVNRYLKSKNFYPDFIKIITHKQEQEGTHKEKELIIHKKHYVHILREGNYMCILAGSLQLSDSLYAFSGNPTNTNQLARLVRVKSIIPCQEDEVGVPMNIRTPSLNLIVNDLWGSSKFESDAGAWGHRLVCLASKMHPQAGQKLQDWAFALNLDRLLP